LEKGALRSLVWWRFGDFSAAQLYEALRFRQAIFVVEQSSPYGDLDGHDEAAEHLLLRIDGTLAGYLRLIPPCSRLAEGASVRVGRVAVAAAFRRQGLAHRLMAEALARVERDYPDQPITLDAQTYLLPFYEQFGFRVTGEAYDDFGVPHVAMTLPPHAGRMRVK
jgi:ElaA protein